MSFLYVYVCFTEADQAGVAQLVERQLPKLQAVGSRPISRSRIPCSPSGTYDTIVSAFLSMDNSVKVLIEDAERLRKQCR